METMITEPAEDRGALLATVSGVAGNALQKLQLVQIELDLESDAQANELLAELFHNYNQVIQYFRAELVRRRDGL